MHACYCMCVFGEQRKISSVGPYHLPCLKQGVVSFTTVYCRLVGLQTSKDFSACLSSECWHYRFMLPCLTLWGFWGSELKSSHSTRMPSSLCTELTPQPQTTFPLALGSPIWSGMQMEAVLPSVIGKKTESEGF